MRQINQRGFEGKKVTQVEQELKTQKSYTLYVLNGVLGFIIVILIINMFSLKKEITELKSEGSRLLKENTALKIELETSQINSKSAEKKVEPAPPENNAGQSKIIYHHIQSGDNLPSISLKYYGKEIYARPLAQLNGLNSNSLLQPGQVLQIPREPDPTWGN